MPGFRGAKSSPERYGTEHRKTRASLLAELEAAGSGTCAEPVCVMTSRLIHTGMRLVLSHDPTGTVTIGLSHASCNQREAARRAGRKGNAMRAVREGRTAPYW